MLNLFTTYLAPEISRIAPANLIRMHGPLSFPFNMAVAVVHSFSPHTRVLSVVLSDKLSLHGFADDHALRPSFIASGENEASAFGTLENSLQRLQELMESTCNRLRMNNIRSEYFMFGSRQQLN